MKINTAEAAYIAGVTAATIRRHIYLGNLDAWQNDTGRWVMAWDEFDCWLAWAWRSGSCYMNPPEIWPGLAEQIRHRQMSRKGRKALKQAHRASRGHVRDIDKTTNKALS